MNRKIIVNDKNMESLAQFVGKQSKINIQILSYLNQLPKDIVPSTAQYHLEETQRLIDGMAKIFWDTM